MCTRELGAVVVRAYPQSTVAALTEALGLIPDMLRPIELVGGTDSRWADNESSLRDQTCMMFEEPSFA